MRVSSEAYSFFVGLDRAVEGEEILIAAESCSEDRVSLGVGRMRGGRSSSSPILRRMPDEGEQRRRSRRSRGDRSKRIDALFEIEREINGLSAEERLQVRKSRAAPLLVALEAWLREQRPRLSCSSLVAQPIDYTLKTVGRLARFADNGRIA